MRPDDYCGPATSCSPFESHGLGWSDFARHYSRNHCCFLFLQVLRWFTSLSSLDYPMYSDKRNRCSHRLGFPIRKSPDHRLLASPRSLSQLTTSFIACLRQGIHTHALSSLTIKSTSNTNIFEMFILALASISPALPRLRGTRQFMEAALLVIQIMPVKYSIVKDQTSSVLPEEIEHRFSGRPEKPPSASSRLFWWAWVDSNYRPHPYQGCALTN
jgi:hypothetical protein